MWKYSQLGLDTVNRTIANLWTIVRPLIACQSLLECHFRFGTSSVTSNWIIIYLDNTKTLNFHWQNSTDTVNLAFTNPKIVQAGSPVVRTNATIFGNPEYLRLSGA